MAIGDLLRGLVVGGLPPVEAGAASILQGLQQQWQNMMRWAQLQQQRRQQELQNLMTLAYMKQQQEEAEERRKLTELQRRAEIARTKINIMDKITDNIHQQYQREILNRNPIYTRPQTILQMSPDDLDRITEDLQQNEDAIINSIVRANTYPLRLTGYFTDEEINKAEENFRAQLKQAHQYHLIYDLAPVKIIAQNMRDEEDWRKAQQIYRDGTRLIDNFIGFSEQLLTIDRQKALKTTEDDVRKEISSLLQGIRNPEIRKTIEDALLAHFNARKGLAQYERLGETEALSRIDAQRKRLAFEARRLELQAERADIYKRWVASQLTRQPYLDLSRLTNVWQAIQNQIPYAPDEATRNQLQSQADEIWMIIQNMLAGGLGGGVVPFVPTPPAGGGVPTPMSQLPGGVSGVFPRGKEGYFLSHPSNPTVSQTNQYGIDPYSETAIPYDVPNKIVYQVGKHYIEAPPPPFGDQIIFDKHLNTLVAAEGNKVAVYYPDKGKWAVSTIDVQPAPHRPDPKLQKTYTPVQNKTPITQLPSTPSIPRGFNVPRERMSSAVLKVIGLESQKRKGVLPYALNTINTVAAGGIVPREIAADAATDIRMALLADLFGNFQYSMKNRWGKNTRDCSSYATDIINRFYAPFFGYTLTPNYTTQSFATSDVFIDVLKIPHLRMFNPIKHITEPYYLQPGDVILIKWYDPKTGRFKTGAGSEHAIVVVGAKQFLDEKGKPYTDYVLAEMSSSKNQYFSTVRELLKRIEGKGFVYAIMRPLPGSANPADYRGLRWTSQGLERLFNLMNSDPVKRRHYEELHHKQLLDMASRLPPDPVVRQEIAYLVCSPKEYQTLQQISQHNAKFAHLIAQAYLATPLEQEGGLTLGAYINSLPNPTNALDHIHYVLVNDSQFQSFLKGLGIDFNSVYTCIIEELQNKAISGVRATMPQYIDERRRILQQFRSHKVLGRHWDNLQKLVSKTYNEVQSLRDVPAYKRLGISLGRTLLGFALFLPSVGVSMWEKAAQGAARNIALGKSATMGAIKGTTKEGYNQLKSFGEFFKEGWDMVAMLGLTAGTAFGRMLRLTSPEFAQEFMPFAALTYHKLLNDPFGFVAQPIVSVLGTMEGGAMLGRGIFRLPARVDMFFRRFKIDPELRRMAFDPEIPRAEKWEFFRKYFQQDLNPPNRPNIRITDRWANKLLERYFPGVPEARKAASEYFKQPDWEAAEAYLGKVLSEGKISMQDLTHAFAERLGLISPTDIFLLRSADVLPRAVDEVLRAPVQKPLEKTLSGLTRLHNYLDEHSKAGLAGWALKRLSWASEMTYKTLEAVAFPSEPISRLTDRLWTGILTQVGPAIEQMLRRIPRVGEPLAAAVSRLTGFFAQMLSPEATLWQALRSFAWRQVAAKMSSTAEEFVRYANPLLDTFIDTVQKYREDLMKMKIPYMKEFWVVDKRTTPPTIRFNEEFAREIFWHKFITPDVALAPNLRRVLTDLKLPESIINELATEANEALFQNARAAWRRFLDERLDWIMSKTKGIWVFTTRQLRRAEMQDAMLAHRFLRSEIEKQAGVLFSLKEIPITQFPAILHAAERVGFYNFVEKGLRLRIWETDFPEAVKIETVNAIHSTLSELLRRDLKALDLPDETIARFIEDYITFPKDQPAASFFDYFTQIQLDEILRPYYLRAETKAKKKAGIPIEPTVPEEISEEAISAVRNAIKKSIDEILNVYFEGNEEALRVVGSQLDKFIKDNNLKLTNEQIEQIVRMVGSTYVPHISPEAAAAALERVRLTPAEWGVETTTGALIRTARGMARLTELERKRRFGRTVITPPEVVAATLLNNTATIVARTIADEYFIQYMGKEIPFEEVQRKIRAAEANPNAPHPIIVAFAKQARKLSLEDIMAIDELQRRTAEIEARPEAFEEIAREVADRETAEAAQRIVAPLSDIDYLARQTINITDPRVARYYRLTREQASALQQLAQGFRATVERNPESYVFVEVEPTRLINFLETVRQLRELGRGGRLQDMVYNFLRGWRNLWAGPLLGLPPYTVPWIGANIFTNIIFGLMFGINPFSLIVRLFKKSKLPLEERTNLLLETFALEGLVPILEPAIFTETLVSKNIREKLQGLGARFDRLWDNLLIGAKVNNKVEIFFRETYAYELAKRFLNRPELRDAVLRTVMRREGLEGILGHIPDLVSLTATLEEVLAMPHFPEKQQLLNVVRDELGRVINHYMLSTPLERWITALLFPFWKYYRHAASLLLLYPLRHPEFAVWTYALGDWADRRIELDQMAKRNKALREHLILTAPDTLFIDKRIPISVVKPSDLGFWRRYFTIVVGPEDEGHLKVLFTTRLFPFLFVSRLLSPDSEALPALANTFAMLQSPWITAVEAIGGMQRLFGGEMPLAVPTPAEPQLRQFFPALVSLYLPSYALTMSNRWVFFDRDTGRSYLIDFNKRQVEITRQDTPFYRLLHALQTSGVVPLSPSVEQAMQNITNSLQQYNILVPEWLLPYIGVVPSGIKEKRKLKVADIFPIIGQVLFSYEGFLRTEEIKTKAPPKRGVRGVPYISWREGETYNFGTGQARFVADTIRRYLLSLQRQGGKVDELMKQVNELYRYQAPQGGR